MQLIINVRDDFVVEGEPTAAKLWAAVVRKIASHGAAYYHPRDPEEANRAAAALDEITGWPARRVEEEPRG